MTLSSRVARLDDASGELTLSLRKLEMEAARGAANLDEQIDFLHDLHRASYRIEILPWRNRAARLALGGVVLAAVALFLPPTLPHRDLVVPGVLILGGLVLLGAAGCLGAFFQKLRRERLWFQQQERTIRAGGSLLQAP